MAKSLSSLLSKGPVVAKGVVDFATPRFNLFLKYARVELVPPTPADIPQIRSGIQKLLTGFRTGKWKEASVKEAWLNSLVTAEVVLWFFIGECIGKRSIVGYHV
ncbi:ATP synthase subunit g, mitochondrial [Zootermopsis nevadensis]|uniref:ATP synthase subunit g n=1 Tax=Zootermopsis nevadensis TaxID=136037 RepID=A0A067R5T8_ZOONE|nr:ATP synthase subunit g, mitochondrial [Zootermopsis nevadensis]KDR17689.1 ATP synthase subunit g, mitochondrial [Zootermopsis nevadensis]